MSQAVFGGAFAPAYSIRRELIQDTSAREALLDRVMGPKRKLKSSETLRRGRMPAQDLSFSAVGEAGDLIGTLRLWNVSAGRQGPEALLLGPLAVDTSFAGRGVGASLMNYALAEVRRLGHGAVLLVGDPGYYERFGFTALLTGKLAMPGPYEKHRLLALELVPGVLAGAVGILQACGRRENEEAVAAGLVA